MPNVKFTLFLFVFRRIIATFNSGYKSMPLSAVLLRIDCETTWFNHTRSSAIFGYFHEKPRRFVVGTVFLFV